jgi:hypothetical protein
MDVSIVIVGYNTCKLLDDCIISIKKETTVAYEIIIVDNASTDNSCQMLREKYPEVKLIENKENVGFARANNQGFAVARGRYFFMLNPDTLILGNAVDKLLAFMDANPDVGICGPKNINPDGSLQYSCDHFPKIWHTFCSYANLTNRYPRLKLFGRQGMRYWDYGDTGDVERVSGCALMVSASLYKKLGGLDEQFFMYFEETDLCYRTRQLGCRVVFIPAAAIIHYGGVSASRLERQDLVNKVISSYYQQSQYRFYYKHYGFLHMLAMRCLDMSYGTILILKNAFRRDKAARSHRLGKGRALCAGAVRFRSSL